jgi:hypothetical protein
LLDSLPASSLLLADLGYFSFPWFDWLTTHFIYFVSRVKAQVTYVELHTFVDTPLVRDRIVYLGKHNSDKASYPVRLVELFIDGEWWSYITNVLDPVMLPGHYLFALYSQRWTIECCFSVLKTVLGLHHLRLCHLQGVQWQLWATVLAYQLVQSVRWEVAVSLGVQSEHISWKQLFESFDLYYREAAGRTDLSAIEWILKHHESLRILKPPRKSERKVQNVPPQLQEVYQQEYPAMPTTLQPRKARYAQRKCGRGIHRNKPTTEKKRVVGRVKKQKSPKVSQDKKKKQPKTKTKTPMTSISSSKPELLSMPPGTPNVSISLEEPTCSTP